LAFFQPSNIKKYSILINLKEPTMETNDRNQAEETIGRVQSGVHETVDKVADATRHAAESLEKKSAQLKNAEQQFVEDCRGYMHENPVTALALAVGVGFILSRLMSS
jgi:ElaB/YqjD/DUF883 family membrane-anchored ribosome-binding protein